MQKTTFRMTETDMEEFRYYLQERENSTATIGKYLHDVRTFKDFLGEENSADKEKLLEYKEWLLDHYAVSSVNSMLVALHQYLGFRGAGQAPAEAGEGTARGSDGGGEDAYQGRVPQAGAHGESRGQGTDRHDHGDHVRHGDPRQRAEILPGGKCAERDGEGLE